MRILHVIHSVDPSGGGVIEGIKQLSVALTQMGVTVEVMSLDAPEAACVRDFPLPLFPLGPGRFGYGHTGKAVPWLVKHGGDYDIILVNGLWQFGGLAVWLASRKTTLRYAVFPHGMLDPWFKRHYPFKHLKKWLYWPWAEYRVLRDAFAVFFTSEEERRQARQSFWLYRCREHVLGYGIAAPPGNSEAQRALFLQRYPELTGKRLILFLGRLHEKKGCDLLLRAWGEILSTTKGIDDVHLVMAGPGDETYRAHLTDLAAREQLTSRLTWTGMLTGEDKWGAFHAADAFILPSHQENFGVSVVEALACGVPVLISDQVNIWREIAATQAGLVESDNLAGTKQLLRRWLLLSAEERQLMRREANHCFEEKFHVKIVAHRLMTVINRLTI